MRDSLSELRDKANYYRERAAKALTEKERDILLAIAAENERMADQLEALKKKP